MHEAVKSGELSLVKYLCESKARIDAQMGFSLITPLHLAVEHESRDIVLYLLQHKANANAQDHHVRHFT